MRLIFVRHGEPNYVLDCLTEEGHRQAEAAAARLAGEGITKIYASTCGRAAETAAHTAARLGLEVIPLAFMREISWGGDGLPHGGHPWTLSDDMMDEGFDFFHDSWREHEWFRENAATRYYDEIASRIDALLARHGYIHRGRRCLCQGGTDETVALFSHGGSGGCAMAHLLGLPLPYVLSVMLYDYTSISVLSFRAEEGVWVHPRLELFNDCAHIARGAKEPAIQQEVT